MIIDNTGWWAVAGFLFGFIIGWISNDWGRGEFTLEKV